MANFNIRDIPDDLARKVKAQAAADGITLHDFVVAVLRGKVEPEIYLQGVPIKAVAHDYAGVKG